MDYRLYLQEDVVHDAENGDTPAKWIGIDDKQITYHFDTKEDGISAFENKINAQPISTILLNDIKSFKVSGYEQWIVINTNTQEIEFEFGDRENLNAFVRDLKERRGLKTVFVKKERAVKRFILYLTMSVIAFLFCYMVWEDGGCDGTIPTLMIGGLALFGVGSLSLATNAIMKKHEILIYT